MLKQWKNENLGVIYFYIPNSKKNEILTSDGVLLPYDEFKSMSSEEYLVKKNTNGGYDYNLSRKSERLVKKAVNITPTNTQTSQPNGVNKSVNEFTKTSSSYSNTISTDVEKLEKVVKKIKSEQKTKSLPQKKIKVPKETIIEKKEEPKIEKPKRMHIEVVDEPTEEQKSTKNKDDMIEPKIEINSINNEVVDKEENKEISIKTKKEFNWFDFAYPRLTLIIVIICSCLSIFFTGTYMQRLQTVYVAYAISSAILIYGIIGMQMARRSWKAKKYGQAFIFGITAIAVLMFSMFSAVDVNYARFKESHQSIEESYNVNDGKKLSYDLMKEELADNKKQIELLNEDIKFQQTQWVLSWDSELKKNVLLEGRISATAQQKITDDNVRIEELNKRNKEINEKLMEYAESGISVEKIESKTERAKSLTDLIGALFGISGNIVQLIILLIPSIFCDLINILGTTIYCQKFEEEKEKQ